MVLQWRAEPDGRHWTAFVDGRRIGDVTRLTWCWQGQCLTTQPWRYSWLTRPCDTLEEAQGELIALVLGERKRWVRPDTRFKQKVRNRPIPEHPGEGWRPVANEPG